MTGDHRVPPDHGGAVEEVTLRITRLRDANGVVWYVRNGEIVRVANRSQGWSTSLVDIPVAYDSDIHTVTHVLEGVVDALEADPEWSEKLIERPNVAGVESVAGGTMTFRIIAKTAPNENFGVSRELRRRSVIALEDAGVTEPVELSLQYSNDHYGPSSGDEYALIKDQLEESGLFTVDLQTTEWVQYSKDRTADVFPAYQLGWYPDYSDADNYLTPFFLKENFLGNHYDNPTVNDMILEQATTVDPAARTQLIRRRDARTGS